MVVLATPVGNPTLWASPAPAGYVGGRARANWQVSIGAAASGVVAGEDAGGGSTISEGVGTINTAPAGQPIHITNNVPHIMPLNEGHSLQAPAGFIQRAVAQASGGLEGFKLTEDTP